uniref:Galactosyltransferase N-terminal domain-containing protein n=1 Tax=Schistocephalus solidus TaxID=70667 RepID=A0A0V0J6G9_SCHSO
MTVNEPETAIPVSHIFVEIVILSLLRRCLSSHVSCSRFHCTEHILPLVRRLKVDQSPVTFEQLEQEWGEGALPRYFGLHNQLKLDSPYQLTPLDNVTAVEHRGGGVWNPVNCRAQQTVAIIMPFRDRYDNLTVFLKHIHPFLRHQKIAYTIFVVEQVGLNTSYDESAIDSMNSTT